MSEYIPTIEDIIWAKKVYDDVIWTQVLNPTLVLEAHKKLFGFSADNKIQAKIRVFNWFQYQFKPSMIDTFLKKQSSDSTETADITTPSIVGESSHSEGLDKNIKTDNQDNTLKKQSLEDRIAELEQEYQTTTDTGRKRSISMKITNMKKKLK
jgi:hypothetical protein